MQSNNSNSFFFPQQLSKNSVNKSNLPSYENKRNDFHENIRKNYRKNYQKQMRQRHFFKNNIDYSLLKDIDLKNTLQNLLRQTVYKEWNYQQGNQSQAHIHNKQMDIDSKSNSNLDKYELNLVQNKKFTQTINEIYLYFISEQRLHIGNLIEDEHINRLVYVLGLNVQSKQKDQPCNTNNRLEPLFESILAILTSFTAIQSQYHAAEQFLHVIIDILNKMPNQGQVVADCLNSAAMMFQNSQITQLISNQLSSLDHAHCIVSIAVNTLEKGFQFIKNDQKCSKKICSQSLIFFKALFQNIRIVQLYPQIRRRIIAIFTMMYQSNDLYDEILIELSETVQIIIQKNINVYPELLLQTEQLLEIISKRTLEITTNITQKSVTKVQPTTKQLFKSLLNIWKQVYKFQNKQIITQRTLDFVYDMSSKYLLKAVQKGLKNHQTFIIYHCLQLLTEMCYWGDLLELLEQRCSLNNKLFVYASNGHSFTIKSQAINCLCTIVRMYFQDHKYTEGQYLEKYQTFVVRNQLIRILYDNFDQYVDLLFNQSVLNAIQCLCQFWNKENLKEFDELNGNRRRNKFWEDFAIEGGQIKFEQFLLKQNTQDLHQKVTLILQRYAIKQDMQYRRNQQEYEI